MRQRSRIVPDLDLPRVKRRDFLKLLGTMLFAHALGIEPGGLVVRRETIPIPDLPGEMDGLRIGQISDFHRSPFMPRVRVERAVAAMVGEAPDLVALTGDFVSYRAAYAGEYPEILSPLRPPLGCFACTGNHDLRTDVDVVCGALERAGVVVLRNAHRLLDVGGARLCIAGVDDVGRSHNPFRHTRRADDLPAALAGSPLSGVIHLLLVHNPVFVKEPVFAHETSRRPIHLVLSGHTHGGQVRLPFLGAPHLLILGRGTSFDGGLMPVAGTWVYISRGAGSSWPVRFNCPPEVNVLTLRGI